MLVLHGVADGDTFAKTGIRSRFILPFFRMERIGGQFHVVLTAEQVAELWLSEGAVVELRTSDEVARSAIQ